MITPAEPVNFITNLIDLTHNWNFETIVVSLSITAALITVLANGILPSFRLLRRVWLTIFHFFRPHADSGIYRAEMYDGRGHALRISDAVSLTRKGKNIRIRPIFRKNSSLNFSFQVQEGLTNIYEGSWENIEKPYKGFALLYPTDYGYEGLLIGNTSNFRTNYLRIWLIKVQGGNIKSLKLSTLRRFLNRITRPHSNYKSRTLTRIVDRHQKEQELNVFNKGDIELNIQHGCCNPAHSTFSTHLLEYAKKRTPENGEMLDVGCGSGYYAIAFAKRGYSRTVGIDFPDILPIARANAQKNDVGKIVQTRISTGNDVFANLDPIKDKFDVILANLPIEREDDAYQLRSSPYYRSFVAEDGLFASFITYLKLFLKPGGTAYFCHYGPNENERLAQLINASGLVCYAEPFQSKFSDQRYYTYTLKNVEPHYISKWRKSQT